MYTDSGLARLTGLDRHTVERRRRERENGDFVATIRQPKTREEKAMAAAQGIARAIERQGVEALAQALGLLPAHIREDALQAVAGYREAGI
jgi:DnaJ-domain-containing protein 1